MLITLPPEPLPLAWVSDAYIHALRAQGFQAYSKPDGKLHWKQMK